MQINNNKRFLSIQRLEGVVVFFLKHLYHARQIRNRILECFERASNPTIPKVQRDRLLSFIVVGGGPTSCEFMSELHEFINQVGSFCNILCEDDNQSRTQHYELA